MPKTIKCPVCREETFWENNKYKPFCGSRCRLIDLGHWADGSYKIKNPDDSVTEEEIEEVLELESTSRTNLID